LNLIQENLKEEHKMHCSYGPPLAGPNQNGLATRVGGPFAKGNRGATSGSGSAQFWPSPAVRRSGNGTNR
jgi:hypothetical protein